MRHPGYRLQFLSGFGRGEAMRGMHKGIYRAYATSPHDVQATIKAVFPVSYILPASRSRVARYAARWLQQNAFWDGGKQAADE